MPLDFHRGIGFGIENKRSYECEHCFSDISSLKANSQSFIKMKHHNVKVYASCGQLLIVLVRMALSQKAKRCESYSFRFLHVCATTWCGLASSLTAQASPRA